MNLFQRFSYVVCCGLFSILLGSSACADPSADRPVLRAVFTEAFPYSFTGEDGRTKGFNVDVTRQLADAVGFDVRFIRVQNSQQILHLIQQGEADVTPFMALTNLNRGAGLATSSLGEYALSVYVRRDRDLKTIEALAGKRVGVIRGEVTEPLVARFPFAQLIEYETSDEVLLPLLTGEIDAVVSIAETFEARLRTHFIEDKIRRLRPPLASVPYGLIIRRDMVDLHVALENVILTRVSQAGLAPLRAHWFGRSRSIVEHPWFNNVALIVGGIGTAMIALTIYAVRLRGRSAQLQVENRENKLLIDALDKIGGAITIFGNDMKGVHWNNGFIKRFPQVVPKLREGADIETVMKFAFENEIFLTDMTKDSACAIVDQAVQRLHAGGIVQQIVETPGGNTYDLNMFRLGERHFAAIWLDVSELYRQQAQIAEQSEELERKNQQLLAFSTMAAHDLKAPLVQQAALIGFIQEDLEDAGLNVPDQAQENFHLLEGLSSKMNVLVADLLSYAKADTDASQVACFAPNDRFDGITALSAIHPQIKLSVMPDMPAVQVDPHAFDLVMRNLITNAAKHHDKPTGQIIIRAARHKERVVFEVEDDGPGIPESQQEKIFEPFCRLTAVEGAGLGLAFVKKTVEGWGGGITMRAAPARGCIFEVALPAAPIDPMQLEFHNTFTQYPLHSEIYN